MARIKYFLECRATACIAASIFLSIFFLANEAGADIPPDLATAVANAESHGANPIAAWIPADGSIIETTDPGDVYGLKYVDAPANTSLIVRTATKTAYWGNTAKAAGQAYTTHGTAGTDADWVTTGNDLTSFYDNKGSGETNSDLIKLIERGLGMNNVGTHDAILEYVVTPGAGQVLNDVLMRASKNPKISDYSTAAADYGDPASFPALGDSGMTDNAAFTTFKTYYDHWRSIAYNSSNNMPWTQFGYTYFWGNGDAALTDIQGMSEFLVMAQTSVTVYGLYTTSSYIYTKNDGTDLSSINPTDQYGNGFASFNITGDCDSVWAGHRFQAKTKSDDVEGTANTISNSGTISGGQGILVWSLNYDLTNTGTISGATTAKCGLSDTANIAVLFKGDETAYAGSSVHVPTGINELTNSGTIYSPGTAVKVQGGQTMIANTGTISGADYAVNIDLDASNKGNFTLTNTNGTIASDGYAIYTNNTLVENITVSGGAITGDIYAGTDATDILTIKDNATINTTLKRSTSATARIVSGDTRIAEATPVIIQPTIAGTSNIQNNEIFLFADTLDLTHTTAANITVNKDSAFPMITFTPSVSGTQIFLTAARSAAYYTGACQNSSLGSVLDSVANSTSEGSDMAYVIQALDSSGSASNAQQLEPNTDNSSTQANNETMTQFINNILSRFDNVKDVQTQNYSDPIRGTARDSTGIWAQGFDTYMHQDPRGSSNGYNANIWGTSLGFDTPVPALTGAIVGLSGGYANNHLRTKDACARTDIDTYSCSLYGSLANDAYYFDMVGAFAYNVYSQSRRISFAGVDRTPTADYGGQLYSGYFEGGYTFKNKNLTFTPLMSVQYSHIHVNSYNEKNAESLALSVKEQDYDAFLTGVGAKLAYKIENKTCILIPDLHMKWVYDFIGDRQETSATLAGGGPAFTTNGFDPAKSRYDFGTKLMVIAGKNLSFTANYDFGLKEDFYSHSGYLNVRYDF